ncbi:MAG: hypothetical protein H7844_14350 [Nitrospirae bacterium YQR-1]
MKTEVLTVLIFLMLCSITSASVSYKTCADNSTDQVEYLQLVMGSVGAYVATNLEERHIYADATTLILKSHCQGGRHAIWHNSNSIESSIINYLDPAYRNFLYGLSGALSAFLFFTILSKSL